MSHVITSIPRGRTYRRVNQWRTIRFFLVFVAVIHHLFFLYHYHRVNWDELQQVGLTRTFMEDGRLMLRITDSEDLSMVTEAPFIWFAMGYSVAMAPAISVFGSPVRADFMLEALASLLFFLAWYAILELLREQLGEIGLTFLWVYWAVVANPLLAAAWTDHATDMLSLAFFSLNIVLCMVAVLRQKRAVLWAALGGVSMGLAALSRYAYWPLAGILPLALVIFYLAERRNWRKALPVAGINAFFAGVFILGHVYFNNRFAGAGVENFPITRPYFDHLTRTASFPLYTLGWFDPRYFANRGETAQMLTPPEVV